eukprot:5793054-Amphidinium_carterae.1
MVFRDAILEVMERMLDNDDFPIQARDGLCALIDFVGERFREMSASSTSHLQTVEESWKLIHEKAAENAMGMSRTSSSGSEQGDDLMAGFGEGGDKMQLPTTFAEMFDINAAMMGFSGKKWMTEVLESMDAVMTHVTNLQRVREEASVLALRLSGNSENVVFSEFKACMMAALRSLLLQHWTSTHEVAWGWVLANVEHLIECSFVTPAAAMERGLQSFLDGLDDAASYDMRKAVYTRFFERAPAGQDYFK